MRRRTSSFWNQELDALDEALEKDQVRHQEIRKRFNQVQDSMRGLNWLIPDDDPDPMGTYQSVFVAHEHLRAVCVDLVDALTEMRKAWDNAAGAHAEHLRFATAGAPERWKQSWDTAVNLDEAHRILSRSIGEFWVLIDEEIDEELAYGSTLYEANQTNLPHDGKDDGGIHE